MAKYSFLSSKIYNMVETSISTVQDPAKIIASKSQNVSSLLQAVKK